MSLYSKTFYNRDLSWLRFNHRVLQEAADKRNPLLERIRFLAIFSSNLDEFYKVRVSEIRQIKQLKKPLRKRLISKPKKLLKEIKKQVDRQQQYFGRIYRKEIIPELKSIGIQIIGHSKFNKAQKAEALQLVDQLERTELKFNIMPIHNPKVTYAPENECLYLTALSKDQKLILVKIPHHIPRFYTFSKTSGKHCITFIDDIFKYYLTKKFQSTLYALKISRDAALYIDDEYSGDLVEKIKAALPHRDTGQITRALVDNKMPEDLLNALQEVLNIDKIDIIKGGRYHNFKDFFKFPNPEAIVPEYEAFTPQLKSEFTSFSSRFNAIKAKDRLSYFPYDAFDDLLLMLHEAAHDPAVTEIKITLYRISEESEVAKTLITALENGKKVYAFMECKARFDEENNLKWGTLLERNGATVQYSQPGIKVHSKIMYILRKESKQTKAYGYVGTGNFNEKTAKVYTDFGLYTAHNGITSEIDQVFQVLQGRLRHPSLHHLIVSPFSTRSSFSALINTEINNALKGKKAYIILKLNSLQDEKMIHLLYKANNAGVKIRLIVRGICCLVPGIIHQSEHIRVTSIVHRYLEHGRVYVFGNGGDEKMYMGSADFMTRNLDHRIEVIVPILDKEVQLQLKKALMLQINEKVKARIIDEAQKNTYIGQVPKEVPNTYFM
ncbi:polyphosphate kinase 1 [Arenibacter sp. GZD96]|uniref:polyphosphate kinase 1 n=1 Tax=Aurantibrevibacter litoralis TaxID=3106030 RepID=UPI002AFFBC00|nr:polyphosphate kinase 1 [Arenibacter sp. GZD-96]MEA1786727.1 polyphosphate kinase 1 [Arenibacter sp. GZD-96]